MLKRIEVNTEDAESAVSTLRERIVQLKTVQELLGHSTIATTADIYSHVSSEMREEVVNKMGSFFRSKYLNFAQSSGSGYNHIQIVLANSIFELGTM